jgi:hypothetical protein
MRSKSTLAWQGHLEALFHRAKDHFPDVVWAHLTEVDAEPTGEQVYGHKGITFIISSHRDTVKTHLNSQLSYTPALHQASKHDISPNICDDDQDDDRSVEPPTLMLPSPPFMPPSLHFVLGFIYTGTLIFSNRTHDP